jgi:hypothetical protein
LLSEAADSADAAFCAAVVLAHPLVLLTPQSTVNRLHEVAVRGEPHASAEEWKLLDELFSTFAEAEARLP